MSIMIIKNYSLVKGIRWIEEATITVAIDKLIINMEILRQNSQNFLKREIIHMFEVLSNNLYDKNTILVNPFHFFFEC